MSAAFPLDAWLDRVGLPATVNVGEEGLRRLHAAQAFSIPFENLDIHLGRAISLEPADIEAKLIGRRRGGYCYELNGLFLRALRAQGFAARPVLARVMWNRPAPGPRSHLLLLIDLPGRTWIADVGLGGPGLRLPLPLEPGREDRQGGETFRLVERADLGLALQKAGGDGWLDLYAFVPGERTQPEDIVVANHFASTWPDSLFRLRRMVALPTERGRLTLLDDELAETVDGITTRRTVPPGPAYLDVLESRFGIRLDGALAA